MIKKLAKSIRQYKKQTILTPISVAIEVVLEVLIPFILANLLNYLDAVNAGTSTADMGVILKYGGLLILFALVSLFFGAFSGVCAARASTGFARNLRSDMYKKIQKFSFSNIDKFSTSSLVTRMTYDVNFTQNAFQMLIRIAVRAPMMLVFSLIMAFVISPNIAWIFLIAIPVLFGGLLFIMFKVKPIFYKVFKKFDKLNEVVQENVRGIRVVKAYVREEYEKEKFKDVNEDIYKNITKAQKITAYNGPLMQLCLYTCVVLICFVGSKLIVGSNSTLLQIGQLSTLITYAIQILSSLMMLSMVFVMITMSRESARRIVEVLDEEPDIVSPENAITEIKDGSIEFIDVNFSYAKDINKLCLSNVDLKIESGQTIGIIGGTGSSKSTLVQLIPRLYDATFGEVKVGGVNVKDYNLDVLRNQVAFVLQKNELFSGTIKDNLRWGNENATDEEIVEACKLAQAHEFIESFPDKYDTRIEQGGTNVSGGQKQRLCIARALLKKPKIIIFDDSTSAVDTKTDSLIRKGMAEAIPETTKIIIAQRIASVKDADNIIVLDGGKIVAQGKHKKLLDTCEIYQEVYYSQVKGGKNNGK